VRVSSRGDKGVELTWDAEADFESGIRGFVVLRDGHELAQVPPKPVGKFGRPLFQSIDLSRHAVQAAARDALRGHLSQADGKHTYAVITVKAWD